MPEVFHEVGNENGEFGFVWKRPDILFEGMQLGHRKHKRRLTGHLNRTADCCEMWTMRGLATTNPDYSMVEKMQNVVKYSNITFSGITQNCPELSSQI
jgi:hypothetical protein